MEMFALLRRGVQESGNDASGTPRVQQSLRLTHMPSASKRPRVALREEFIPCSLIRTLLLSTISSSSWRCGCRSHHCGPLDFEIGWEELRTTHLILPPFRKERGRMGHPRLWWCQGWATRRPVIGIVADAFFSHFGVIRSSSA